MEISIAQSVILGLVQGVTEFLPISSSGHIILAQYIFGITEPSVEFVVALHVGSVIAVVLYFWRDWLNLFRIKNDMPVYQKNKNLLFLIIIATVPAAFAGVALYDFSESLVSSPVVTALLIVIGSAIIYVADKFFAAKKDMSQTTLKDSIIIGIAQIFALVPGVSRSGMTIAAARTLGLTRVDAARFSFLIATPIIASAGLMQILSVSSAQFNAALFIGAITSFFAALATIHYFLALIQKISYAVFLYYAIGFFLVVLFVLG